MTDPNTPQQPDYSAAPAPSGQYAAAPNTQKTNVLAIISLVSAFFISLVAVITGHIALSQIKKTGEQGRGLAIAGLVIGYIGLVVGVIVFIFWIAVIGFAASSGNLNY
ncbi:hypothetical protein ARHIZOSPH14_22420 [Agromyces rhizosphaerae]|uniref:DUF4190 domain-containing protein n=1 Tax=Agromyces rhizosphaerae TaxID=88374 RepID=A0A9W6CX83_9MICO|nr:DUF4190 domain-containing protein [Agromyces rhizosphaerae]GLI28000.1 hypothetical protein ARHIZOSPH14_22420 [Agromyces rhizosphaerae]